MSDKDSKAEEDGSNGANSSGASSGVVPQPTPPPEPNIETGAARSVDEVGASVRMMSSTMAAAAASMKPTFDYSAGLAGLAVMPVGLAAAMGNMKPMFDYSGLAGLSAMSSTVAAAAASMKPTFDYSAGLAGLAVMPVGLAAAMADITNSRLLMLERGFAKSSGVASDYFGELETVVSGDPQLNDSLRRAVATTQRVGSFGLDYNSLQRGAAEVAARLDREPASEKRVRSALEPVQELTGLTDELLFELGGVVGLWTRVTHHKLSTAGIIFGFTAGLSAYIFGAGSGISAVPSAVVQAIILGGGIYGFVHRHEDDSDAPAE